MDKGDARLAFDSRKWMQSVCGTPRIGPSRLDENTSKIIEHGRRIRACLKQPEFAPVSVPTQITMLLALTAELFDRVPLHQMTEAAHALREAAAGLPADLRERLDTAASLSDEDRATIILIARKALAGFQPKPEVHTQATPKPKPDTEENS